MQKIQSEGGSGSVNPDPIRLVDASLETLDPVNDVVVQFDATTGALTFILPTVESCSGWSYLFKKVDSSANAITINPVGSETIDGQLTYVLSAQYDAVELESDGVEWMVRGSYIGEGSENIDGNIVFSQGANHTISVTGSTTTNAAGGALTESAGDGNGSGNGGAWTATGGNSTTGTGGAALVAGGANNTTGNGGTGTFRGGNATTGNGGLATLRGGQATTGTGGGATIDGGAGSVAGGAVSIGLTNASGITIGHTGIVTQLVGNVGLGLAALGTAANLCLGLSNAATRPTTSVDMVQLYGTDIQAGAASLGIEAEEAVAVEVIAASTHVVRIKWNNVMYKILLSNV